MQIFKPTQDLLGIICNEDFLKNTKLLQCLCNSSTRHVLQIHVEAAIDVIMAKVCHDVRVCQTFQDIHLVLQILQKLVIISVVNVDQHFLDCQDLTSLLVQCLEHPAQGTASNHLSPH